MVIYENLKKSEVRKRKSINNHVTNSLIKDSMMIFLPVPPSYT